MTLAEALKILKEANIVTEGYPVRMSARKWKEIVDRWAAKVKEQEDLLSDNPQWIGRPAEMTTKKLIKKYKGYYEQALKKAQELEYQEDEKIRAMKYYEDLTSHYDEDGFFRG